MMKIAIVHEWFVSYAGSEKVVEQMLNVFPEADLFSVVDFMDDSKRGFMHNKHATTTFIQKLPFAKKKYRSYLPLMPLAIEQLDLSEYDVIISSSHAVSKGVITGPNQLHISYVHSPIRYAWDLQHQYLRESGLSKGLKGLIAKYILHRIRIWDLRTANGVDFFVANSGFISKRIWKVYRRESDVIYPPVDVESFDFQTKKSDYYLTASRMVPYKKVDLIVRAFTQMPDKKLYVIGDGPDYDKIQKLAGPNVKILGYQDFSTLRKYMQNAKAFVFAAEEDFGIVPVEAQACGTPVVAYGKGGALETVRGLERENSTGVFFEKQTVNSIIEAIAQLEKEYHQIKPENCRANAKQFATDVFIHNFRNYVQNKIDEFSNEQQQ